MEKKAAEKGTQENPFDNLQDAFDACTGNGPGRIFWVDNPNGRFFDLEKVEEEDGKNRMGNPGVD